MAISHTSEASERKSATGTQGHDGKAPTAERPGGLEAVAFTAGLKGASFGAGVIHAWLASDRRAPLVAAGISMGAIASAAMRQCYRELESQEGNIPLESRRWTWFRRYLDLITNNPLGHVWRAIPDPVDFFADSLPVRDLAVPDSEAAYADEARWNYYLLTRLGVWLGGLPVRVSTLAGLTVYWVRWKEKYGFSALNGIRLLWNALKLGAGLWWHVAVWPQFVVGETFDKVRKLRRHSGRGAGQPPRWVRPLFGWRIWLCSLLPFLSLAVLVGVLAAGKSWPIAVAVAAGLWVLGLAGMLAFLYWKAPPETRRKWGVSTVINETFRDVFSSLGMEKGAVSQYELKRSLLNLFGDKTTVGRQSGDPEMELLLVCASLQKCQQVWPKKDVPLVNALLAATAIPGVFQPTTVPDSKLGWSKDEREPAHSPLDGNEVIDGASVRHNPIPAFFEWCGREGETIARQLEGNSGAALHVVYNVPTGSEGSLAAAPSINSLDIVDAAFSSLQMEKRRDTRQEVRQTNFLSKLEEVRQRVVPDGQKIAYRIFADEIAPARDIQFRNEWDPARDESLRVAAEGCRRTLSVLYRDELLKIGIPASQIPCAKLLRKAATRREQAITTETPGLPEICEHCTRLLSPAPKSPGDDAPPPGTIRSYGEKGQANLTQLPAGFKHLGRTREQKPRVVFLGSGGVFRGAFHIGVIGAMQAAQLYPDLVVGASVGALMGGALAAISVAPVGQQVELLQKLATVFLEVDRQVALSRTLKNAAKQLGVRAREIHISPSILRRIVLRGTEADPGFAATGAPPALIDAISTMFTIPQRRTGLIASEFVAGHFTKAVNCFLKEVRRETLTSFEIERFLIGISLLKTQAEKMLGQEIRIPLNQVQPYHGIGQTGKEKNVSFFATTSFLNASAPLLLGRDFLTEDPTWDFTYATLSSSAFPAAFSPRSEAEVVPGLGRADRLFADGGMFDNLPFFPAIEVLSAGQTTFCDIADDRERINDRAERRDVIIAAGLNAEPVDERSGEPEHYDTLFKIRTRAGSLSVNSKVATFISGAKKVDAALKQIARSKDPISPADQRFLDSTVNAAVLKVVPTDKDHINPTFAFCRSAGLEEETVQKSIADGCFRTLSALIAEKRPDIQDALRESRVPDMQFADDKTNEESSGIARLCPHFTVEAKPLACPFGVARSAAVAGIRSQCARDPKHKTPAG